MCQFSAFPYFPANSIDLRLNRLHLFNFWEFKDAYIPDAKLKAMIEKLASLYVDTNRDRLHSLTISIIDDDYSFEQLPKEQIADLQRYASALMYCSLIKNSHWTTCVPEHFTLIHQNFKLDEDAIAYRTGSYHTVTNWQPFERTRLIRPDYIEPAVLNYRYDPKLLTAFTNMVDSHDHEDDYIFRVLDWVRYAFLNSEGYNYESRNVMMATAFEILFKLQRSDKTANFANALEELLRVNQMEVFDSSQNRPQTGLNTSQRVDGNGNPRSDRRGNVILHTVYGWWARDYYGLRSKVVHEGVVQRGELFNHNGIEHLKIALRMMTFCFYRILENKGHLVHGSNPQKWIAEHHLREVEDAIS